MLLRSKRESHQVEIQFSAHQGKKIQWWIYNGGGYAKSKQVGF